MEDRVLVYRYLYWDEASKAHMLSSEYATLEMIRNGLGTPVHAESLLVPAREVVNGMLTRAKPASGRSGIARGDLG